jgi:MHS family proline/betaine transporter-like MFS transporter
VEHAPPQHRGLIGSFGQMGVVGGLLLGSAVGAILTTVLDGQAVAAWGWRVPFILGIAVGMTGFYIRRHAEAAAVPAENVVKSPVAEAFRTEWRGMVRIFAINIFGAITFYMSLVYVTT